MGSLVRRAGKVDIACAETRRQPLGVEMNERLREDWQPDTPNALGFVKSPADTRVVVAMSGGVDSSVTAAMLHARGYEVIGITLQLYEGDARVRRPGACCAGQDIYDARRVAERCGFPHYVLDYESIFSEAVITDFVDSYLKGETPIPCVRCNERVKFADLLATARELGADCLATGHYVRRSVVDGRPVLLRARDPQRDQSYFLFSLTRAQLDFLRFPLGDLRKREVRAIADALDLPVADKPDSQDICFVPDGDYAAVIEKLRPGAAEAGEIVHVDGRVLGRHRGIIHYTVGQRRGLGIGGQKEPLYVVAIDASSRRVIVGPQAALQVAAMTVRDVNWLGEDALSRPGGSVAVTVKFRHAQPPVPAVVAWPEREEDPVRVRFAEPALGVSPGQAAVFYDGDRILGGGWIARTERLYAASAAA